MASNPPSASQQPSLSYPYNLNFQSSTSVAIIIVVLGATFFFMFLFVIYIKRCNTERFDATAGDGMMLAPGGGAGGPGGGAAAWNPQQQQRMHGLDPEILHKFPILQFSSLDRSGSKNVKRGKIEGPVECAVCLGAFEESELLRILPACGHLFHPDCIDMWLHTHSTCPLCRRSLSRDAVSGHLLQRALAAIASLRGNAVAQEIDSSSPDNSSPPPPPARSPRPPPPSRSSTNEEELDLEAQQGQGQGHDHEHEQILRALSRNSESFKAAAHSLEIQDVREKLWIRGAGASSSSGRYSSSNSISRSNPSSMRVDCSSPGRFRGSDHSAATPLSPIACGRIQHSQSFSNLSAGVAVISPGCSLCQHPDHPQQQEQYRSSSLFSLRRSRSVSASGAVETGKRYSS